MKSDFETAVKSLRYWRITQNMTCFSSQLYSLMCHADDDNKLKFLQGFCAETTAFLLWYTHKDGEAGFLKEYKKYLQ